MINQEKYLYYIADRNFYEYYNQGYATPGNNGPHGHLDTPVRNTSHYLVIYGYLYKKTLNEKYLEICKKFADFLCTEQSKSISGAIQCMIHNDFDYLNGLIGQAWAVEGLLYFYDIIQDVKYLDAAYNIYCSQIYDYKLHLWHRIELDGTDLGVDYTYNHNVWFAACGFKLAELKGDSEINSQIIDFLTHGTKRDFRTYKNGLLKHTIGLRNMSNKENIKKIIKILCTPVRKLYPRKLDLHYIEYAYHIFDMYAFEILKEKYGYLDLFSTSKFKKAEELACNLDWYNRKNIQKKSFNVFSYSYNSPAFEIPYVCLASKKLETEVIDTAFEISKKLMYCDESKMFTKDNYDVELFNARCYEIVRYLERV